MGVTDAGIFGDILCARMKKRGVAALVTDGVVRDVAGVRGDRACRCGARARRRRRRWPASPSSTGSEPIGCGGVAVFPDDCGGGRRRRRGADSRGARSTRWSPTALEQERLEDWIMAEVDARRRAAGPVSAERREQGALRARYAGRRDETAAMRSSALTLRSALPCYRNEPHDARASTSSRRRRSIPTAASTTRRSTA